MIAPREDTLTLPLLFDTRTHYRLPFALLALIAAVVLALRVVNLNTTYDIFIDEVFYIVVAEEVAEDGRVELFNAPFFLHPPANFYLMAGFLELMQPDGNMIDRIYVLRYLNVLLAAASSVLIYLIVWRAAGWKSALLAVALFALDPFISFMNSRVMLETGGVFWMLLGFYLLISQLDERTTRPLSRRTLVFTGIAFGLAILSKDMLFFITLVPLGILFLRNWVFARRDVLVVAAVTMMTYAVYPIALVFDGKINLFLTEKLSGLLRLAGVIQLTGLNRGVGPSFVEKLLERLNQFGSTYLLIGLGVVGLVILFYHTRHSARLLFAVGLSAYGLMTYSILIGTLSDQFFYFLAPPAVLVTTCALSRVGEMVRPDIEFRHATLLGSTVRTGMYAVIVVTLVWSGARWAQAHFTPNNGYERALDFLAANASNARVASTSQTALFILIDGYDGLRPSGPWDLWSKVEDIEAFRPDYVLVSVNQVRWDHARDAQPLLDWFAEHHDDVFRFGPVPGSNTGELIVYKMNW